QSVLVWAALLICAGFGLIGYVDDYLKLEKKNTKGVRGRTRLIFEFPLAGLVSVVIFHVTDQVGTLDFPFFKGHSVNLGIWYIPFSMLVIVGTANAVNLTDGLDGLAIVPVMISAITLAVLAYISGNYKIATYLQIPFVKGAGELA